MGMLALLSLHTMQFLIQFSLKGFFDEESGSFDEWWRRAGNERRNPGGNQNRADARSQYVGRLPGLLRAD
jgi:hypothetical protein